MYFNTNFYHTVSFSLVLSLLLWLFDHYFRWDWNRTLMTRSAWKNCLASREVSAVKFTFGKMCNQIMPDQLSDNLLIIANWKINNPSYTVLSYTLINFKKKCTMNKTFVMEVQTYLWNIFVDFFFTKCSIRSDFA